VKLAGTGTAAAAVSPALGVRSREVARALMANGHPAAHGGRR
jgi:hypothetical protein